MNLMKKLREELANKLANAAADIAENSVDHCNPQGKEAIRQLVKNRTDQLLNPADKKNVLPSDPNEPLVFRSNHDDKPFKVEVKNLGSVWDEIQKRKAINESIINKAEVRVEWVLKF
jgi:hypothetical protein